MQISSDYLDLAIGLAAVFFLASLVVSALAEGIQWPMRVRSKFLWAYLHDLTSADREFRRLPRSGRGITTLWGSRNDVRPRTDPAPGEPVVLAALARALDPIDAPQLTGTAAGTVDGSMLQRPRRTSIQHIPPPSLAQALLEVFADLGRAPIDDAAVSFADAAATDPGAVPAAAARLGTLLAPDDAPAVTAALTAFAGAAIDPALSATAGSELGAAFAALPGIRLGQNLAGAATELAGAIAAAASGRSAVDVSGPACRLVSLVIRSFPDRFPADRVTAAIDRLGDAPLGVTARRLWDAAEGRLDRFRASLEHHLDSEMRRLSGYYRRSIRLVLVVLAIGVTFVANVDALTLTQGLWRNPDGRAGLIAQADAMAAGEPIDTGADEATLARLQQECRELAPVADSPDPDPAAVAAGIQRVRTCVDDALSELTGLGVIDRSLLISPANWLDDYWPPYRSAGEDRGDWLLHLLGVAVSAGALVLGAPFWFDLIKRLTGVRRGLVGAT